MHEREVREYDYVYLDHALASTRASSAVPVYQRCIYKDQSDLEGLMIYPLVLLMVGLIAGAVNLAEVAAFAVQRKKDLPAQ
jgi:hypothetical protein